MSVGPCEAKAATSEAFPIKTESQSEQEQAQQPGLREELKYFTSSASALDCGEASLSR